MLSPIVLKVSLMVSSTPKDSKSFLEGAYPLGDVFQSLCDLRRTFAKAPMMSANVCAESFTVEIRGNLVHGFRIIRRQSLEQVTKGRGQSAASFCEGLHGTGFA